MLFFILDFPTADIRIDQIVGYVFCYAFIDFRSETIRCLIVLSLLHPTFIIFFKVVRLLILSRNISRVKT